MSKIPTRHTIGNTGLPATLLGAGSAPLGNMFTPIEEEDVFACLETAWEGGMRVFDTAPFYGYGLAERRLGDFLRSKPRDEYILCTKVGRLLKPRKNARPTDNFFLSILPFNPVYDYSYDGTMRSYEDSLQRMGLDRFDIMLIHDVGVAEHGDRQPEVFKEAMNGSAKALAKLKEEGEIGAIGLGTNEWEVAEAALDEIELDTTLLAGRYTLLEQEAANTYLPKCQERKVNVILGGVFNSGLLVSNDIANAMWNYELAPRELVDRTYQLKSICDRHAIRLASAALQFAMAHPAVASVVVGLRNSKESEDSINWTNAELPCGLWADLKDEGLIPADAPVPS